METQITTTSFVPTYKDKEIMGKIVRVEDKGLYIQVSPLEDKPHWITIDEFLGVVFGDMIEHKEFVDESLRIYHNKKNNPLFNIIKIMSEIKS